MKTTYATYKTTNIPWLPKLPEQWTLSRVKNHFVFPKNVAGEKFNDYKVLSLSVNGVVIRDMESGKGKYSQSMDTYQVVNPDSIILCLFDMDVTPRIVGHCNDKGIITSAYTVITPKVKIDSKFYYYYFLTLDYNKSLFAQGTGVRATLTNWQFGSLALPLPSFEEQTAIANYLDAQNEKINLLIAKKQKLIDLLKEQKQAIIREIVNSSERQIKNGSKKKLKFVSKVLRGKFTHRPRNDERLYNGKYPFIQTNNVTSAKKYIETYNQTLNDWGYSVSKEFPPNTVVMTIAANIADVAILNFTACFPDSMIGFVPSKEIDTEFLYYSLISKRDYFFSIATISTQLNLNIHKVGNVSLLIPSIEEQHLIVKNIIVETQRIDEVFTRTEKEIELIKEYRQGIIAEVVTGNIKVAI